MAPSSSIQLCQLQSSAPYDLHGFVATVCLLLPAGDWIGVLGNRVEGTVSFSKRGYDLGVAFEGVHEDHLYPIVGFRTPDEEASVPVVCPGASLVSDGWVCGG